MLRVGYRLALVVLTLLLPLYAQGEDAPVARRPTITVDSLVFATNVESRIPTGIASVFNQAGGKVFCWSRISTVNTPVSVKHVWYKDGKETFELSFTLMMPSGRFWSTKTVTAGEWRVDVVDGQGTVLKSGSFTVR